MTLGLSKPTTEQQLPVVQLSMNFEDFLTFFPRWALCCLANSCHGEEEVILFPRRELSAAQKSKNFLCKVSPNSIG